MNPVVVFLWVRECWIPKPLFFFRERGGSYCSFLLILPSFWERGVNPVVLVFFREWWILWFLICTWEGSEFRCFCFVFERQRWIPLFCFLEREVSPVVVFSLREKVESRCISFFRHASVSSIYPCQSVRWSVILFNFHCPWVFLCNSRLWWPPPKKMNIYEGLKAWKIYMKA